jgi:hypothetical protein
MGLAGEGPPAGHPRRARRLVAERHEEDIVGEQLQDMNGGGGMEVPEDRRRLGLGKLN